LIDTHCHLNLAGFFDDVHDVVQQAIDAGVQRMVVVGIDLETSEQALKLAETYPQVYATAGIHPNDCHKVSGPWEQPILEMLAHSRVVAVGETGLDYYWKDSPPELQKRFFWDHLDLALATGLPLVIHNRDADIDVRDLVLEHGNSKGVFHCWPAGWNIAEPLLDKGYHISFTGTVTFKNNHAVHEVATRMPLDRLMLETDSPFLTPAPHRGKKPNEPRYLPHVAEFIAELRGLPVEKIAKQTTINAERFFGLNNA
jgi:TatD DNase family protein